MWDFRSDDDPPSRPQCRPVARGLVAKATYTHVVGTFDGAMMRLFVDGSEVAATTSNIRMVGNDAKLCIGAYGGITDFYAGGLDEVGLYDVALPSARVAAHYKAGK
jgi:hypothetical protein